MSDGKMPHLRVTQGLEDGRGSFRFSFSRECMANLLAHIDTDKPEDISQDVLEQLCYRFGPSKWRESLAYMIEDDPTSVEAVVTDSGNNSLSSADLGHDLVDRLAPDELITNEVLFDPTYAPVEVEIHLHGVAQRRFRKDREVSALVLKTTLYPPDLVS